MGFDPANHALDMATAGMLKVAQDSTRRLTTSGQTANTPSAKKWNAIDAQTATVLPG
jgi:hypothetical protein